eukprot:1152284-Pelagomonas_calceolata.AAC.4
MSKMGLQWPGERWKVGINVIDFLTHGKRDTRMWEERQICACGKRCNSISWIGGERNIGTGAAIAL